MDESVAFPFRYLWKHVSLLFSHDTPPLTEIQAVLRRHLPALQQPLMVKEKNAVDRQAVQSGIIRLRDNDTHLNAEFIENSIKLSDLLNLNEISACELVQSATLTDGRNPEGIPRAALDLFYKERNYLLKALLDLIKGRAVDTLPANVHNLIMSFTDELVNDGLVGVLHTQLSKILKSAEVTSTATDELARHRRQCALAEAVLLSQSLFFLAYQLPFEKDTALALLDVCRETNTMYAQQEAANASKQNTNAPGGGFNAQAGAATTAQPGTGALASSAQAAKTTDASTTSRLFHVAYLTHYTLISVLMHPHRAIRPATGEAYVFNTLFESTQFVSMASSKLKGTWSHRGLHGVLSFAWSLFLESQRIEVAPNVSTQFSGDDADAVDKFLSLALENGALRFIVDSLFKHPVFVRDDENRPFVVNICDVLLTKFLTDMKKQAIELKQVESQFVHSDDPSGAISPASHFADLIRAVSVVCMGSPEYAIRYWKKDSVLLNFVKFAGDYLLAEHYVPYLTMLTALGSGRECADHLFAFLNELHSFVSWSHFFEVLLKYRRELVPGSDNTNRFAPAGHPQAEKQFQKETIDGLVAILKLIQQVLRCSPDKRLVIAHNTQWQPLYSLFELLKCPVPLNLKAALLDTLAEFAKSPEIAGQAWLELEAAQILSTGSIIGSKSNEGKYAGLKFELEERETPRQEYPVTLAFLGFIGELLKHRTVPADLGKSHRVPGVLPYIQFVLNDVFMQFDARSYTNPGDQWKVAESVLSIAVDILKHYDCSDEADFRAQEVEVAGGRRVAASRSCGFEIMSNILSGGMLFRKVVNSVIGIGVEGLRKEAARGSVNTAHCERAITLALELCALVLDRQDLFIRRVRSAQALASLSSLVVGLDSLLMRSQAMIVQIANFIHCLDNPALMYSSVLVVYHLARRQARLPIVFLDHNQHLALIEGYAQCLRLAETDTELVAGEPDAALPPSLQVQNDLYTAVIRVLIDSLEMPSPNLSQLLCGFDVTHDITATTVASAATSGSCLHAVLDLINSSTFWERQSVLVESCYRVLHQLCSAAPTAVPTLLYLRSENQDFYVRHLGQLSEPESDGSESNSPSHEQLAHLRRYAWLMKILALDLHVITTTKKDDLAHRYLSQRIVQLLFGNTANTNASAGGALPFDPALQTDVQDQHRSGLPNESFPMLQLFRVLRAPLPAPPSVEEKLQRTQLRIELNSCIVQQNGVPMYDIGALHHAILQAQRWDYNSRDHDVKTLLAAAVEYNAFASMLHAQTLALDGWKQVLEVTLSHCYNLVPIESRGRALFQLLQAVLFAAAVQDFHPPLPSYLAKVAHSLMFKIREQSTYAQAIDDLFSYPASKCEDLLVAIVKVIMKPSTTHQIRGDMYGTLHHYLKYSSRRAEVASSLASSVNESVLDTTEPNAGANERLWLQATSQGQVDDLAQVNLRVLSHYGEHLVERIGRDSADGHYVWKSLAFAALDTLLVFDQNDVWARNLFTRGVIPQLLEELSHSDTHLRQLLLGDVTRAGVLYVYEALFSLLIQASQTVAGSLSLLEYGVIPILSKAKYLDFRPEIVSSNLTQVPPTDLGGLPDAEQDAAIFRQLWRPPLCLLVSMMSQLGKNEDAAEQVLSFVEAHHKIIGAILKDRASFISEESLDHLGLVTALFYRLCFHPGLLQAKLQARASKYQDIMLNLLSKYIDPENYRASIHPGNELASDGSRKAVSGPSDNVKSLVEDILRNVMGYVRVVCMQWQSSSGGIDAVLFAPFPDQSQSAAGGSQTAAQSSAGRTRVLPLATLVTSIVQTVERLVSYRQTEQECAFKLTQLQPMDVLPRHLYESYGVSAEQAEEMEPGRVINLIRQGLASQSRKIASNIASATFVLENTLVVYWQHLHFYLTRQTESASLSQAGSTVDDLFRASSSLFSLTTADKERLCQQQAATLLPALARISHAAEARSDPKNSLEFSLTLTRRIKSLLGDMGSGQLSTVAR